MRAFQGLSPATLPWKALTTTFTRKGSVLIAISRAPALLSWFIQVNCGSYSATRRGMPFRPSQCWGAKQRLKPTKVSQKWAWPRGSFSRRPVNLGYQ